MITITESMRKQQWLCVLCLAFHVGLGTGTCPENEYAAQTQHYEIVSTDDHSMDKSDTAANDCATESKACRLTGSMPFPFSTTGVTMVMKIRMTGTKSGWERVFALGQNQPTAYTTGDINVFRLDGNQQLKFNVYLINSCHVNHAYTFTQNEDLTVWIRYNPSTQQMQMSVNSQVQTTSGCTMPSLNINQFVAGADHDYGSRSNMDMAGFKAFGRLLTQTEIEAVADSISFGTDDGVNACLSCPSSAISPAGSTSSDACVCAANTYKETDIQAQWPRVSFSAYENEFSSGGSLDNYVFSLWNGVSAKLISGWTHTASYAHGFLRSGAGDSVLEVNGLVPGKEYLYATYNFHDPTHSTYAYSWGLNSFTLYVNGVQVASLSGQPTSSEPTYAGQVAADSSGKILFKFTHTNEHLHLSGLSVEAVCQECPASTVSPAGSTTIDACVCADNQQTVAFKNDKLQAWYKLESDGLDSGPHAAHLQTRLSATANFVSGQYLSVSDDVSFLVPREKTGLIIPAGTTELTVSFWVKNWIDGYVMRWVESNLFFWENSDASKDGEASIEGSTLKTLFTKSSEWTHMLFVFDQTQIVFYENGVFKDHSTTAKIPAGGFVQETDKDAGLFCNPYSASNAHDFRGDIKDIRFYLSAFTSAEAQNLYAGVGSCVQCPTDGTVVEGCEPPCVDGTSFSYWSIRKSVCP